MRKILMPLLFTVLLITSCGEQQPQYGTNTNTTTSQVEHGGSQNSTDIAVDKAPKTSTDYLQNAVVQDDPTGCEAVVDQRKKQACLLTVYNSLAMKELNVAHCDKIEMEVTRMACRRSVLFKKAVAEENIGLCTQLSTDIEKSECRDNYYLQMATKAADSTLCVQIESTTIKAQCEGQIILASITFENAPSIVCNNIVDTDFRSQCVVKVQDYLSVKEMVGGTESEPCNTLSDPGLQEYCRQETGLNKAVAENSKEQCEALVESFSFEGIVEEKSYRQRCLDRIKE